MSIYDPDEWMPEVARPLARALGGEGGLGPASLLCPPKAVADDVAKFLIRDPEGRPSAVLLGSPPDYPDMVERSVDRARIAAAALGPELGAVVLEPLVERRVSGRSYAVLPYNAPLSSNRAMARAQRIALAGPLLSWLRRATQATRTGPIAHGSDPELAGWLEHLAGMREMGDEARAAAAAGLERWSSGAWTPRRVLLHGDLWLGNVLVKPVADAAARGWSWGSRLTLIDWGSSRPDGPAIFDLLQLLESLGASGRTIRREVASHCELLGCDLADASSHLALAMGELGLRLEQFPMDRFVALAARHFGTLREATA